MRASEVVHILQERIDLYGDAPIGIVLKKTGCKHKTERLEDVWAIGCSGMGTSDFVYTIRAKRKGE